MQVRQLEERLQNKENSLPDDWRRERAKHQEHCRLLTKEVMLLRKRYRRETGFRSDLVYQKNYLTMLMGHFEDTYVDSMNHDNNPFHVL